MTKRIQIVEAARGILARGTIAGGCHRLLPPLETGACVTGVGIIGQICSRQGNGPFRQMKIEIVDPGI